MGTNEKVTPNSKASWQHLKGTTKHVKQISTKNQVEKFGPTFFILTKTTK
jgi:hypothetical protein